MAAHLKRLHEQIIVLTGASSGIGLATARSAARRGASLVLAARNSDALEQVAEELRAGGVRVAVCTADVGNEADVERIAETAITEFGGFDTWVNCASVSDYGTLDAIGMDEHRRVFEVNYFGLLKGSLVALDHLRSRGGGAIINVGSILSDRAMIMQGPYSATKHAVRALTEELRMEIEREGLPISVTLIKPSGIHTPFPEHARNHMDEPPRVPQVVYGPELVADAILFAAENPKRQLYVGGNGFFISLMARLFPRMTDLVMEAAMVRGQQSPEDAGDPSMRDNLYAPQRDGQVEGNQDMFVRRQSLFLEAQKRPRLALALGSGAALALWAANRRRKSPRPQTSKSRRSTVIAPTARARS
jgi:short-subunit dehydrogenase